MHFNALYIFFQTDNILESFTSEGTILIAEYTELLYGSIKFTNLYVFILLKVINAAFCF